jgi:4-amino-4-deoxy-L-arabinose transferase-like glycosyltransferase
METQSHLAIDVSFRPRKRLWILLSYLAIGLTALLPRVLNLGLFVTTDEADHWIERSEQFLRALQSGDYVATAIAPHPGVTTMWLGSAGILLRKALVAWSLLQDESFRTSLALMQLPVALTHVVCILLGYYLLRRLLPAGAAALAALLWATDPFLMGYSRVLHVDALAGSFATVSLLAACSYWYHDRPPSMLVLSGVCAGLAILSKSPALAVVPVVGLLALAAAWRSTTNDQRPTTAEDRKLKIEDRHVSAGKILSSILYPLSSNTSSFVFRHWSFVGLLIWGMIAAATIFALWPSLWVDPWRTYAQLRTGVAVEGADPQMATNFFLGRIDNEPGILFYPLALALRLTPWTLIGLLLLQRGWRATPTATRRDLAALAGFVVLFILAMSLFPKKFNRYLVPVFPALDILAAVGLAWLAGRFSKLIRGSDAQARTLRQRITYVPTFLIALLAMLNTALWHPYSITYFNTALGGPSMGAQVFLEGWGEGFEQVATWLNQQPDITGVVTVSPMVSSLRPYMRRRAQVDDPSGDELPDKTGYMVVYIRQVQGGAPDPPFDQFYGRAAPLHTVRIHGVDYAWIYRIPPPVASARPADFGPNIHLRGFEQQGDLRRGQRTAIKLYWETRNAPPIDYTLFAHLIGPDGKHYTQVDIPYPTSSWGARQFITTDLPLELPADVPAGGYRLTIGLYDPASGQRVALATATQVDPTLDGPNALPLLKTRLN